MMPKHLVVTPAQAGVQGNSSLLGPWVPAFAGTTRCKIQFNSTLP